MKYFFDSAEDLISFADEVFSKMGINDDGDHKVELRDEFEHDYILNTKGKNIDEIFTELKNLG